MAQAIIFLDYKRDAYITFKAKEEGMSKHDAIHLCVDRCIDADEFSPEEEEEVKETLADKEFTDLGIGGVK